MVADGQYLATELPLIGSAEGPGRAWSGQWLIGTDGKSLISIAGSGPGRRLWLLPGLPPPPPPPTVKFRAEVQPADLADLAVEYRWDINGDGQVDATTKENTFSATYTVPGSYRPQVTVVDNQGRLATAVMGQLIVSEPTPTPRPTMPTGMPPALRTGAPPHMFYGTLKFYKRPDKSDAYTAPQGSVVYAIVGDAIWEQKPSAGGQTFDYAVTIRARESPEKSVSFYVNGVKADQIATFMEGGALFST